MIRPDPRPVLTEFLPLDSIRAIEPLDGAGGWSGSLLWRIKTDSRSCCLRRWPEGTARERLTFIHQILTHVAAQGIDFVPVPIPTRSVSEGAFVRRDHYLWDLTLWLPGTADYHANPSRPRLTAAMHALARFHTAAASISQDPWPCKIAPVFTDRLDQVRQLVGGDLDRIAAAVQTGLDAGLDLRAGQLLPVARGLLSHLLSPLESACREQMPLSPAIRDIHHDHVLFTGDQVTGLVDFDALRIDTPLADVARLVGSLVAGDRPARQFALDAYSQLRPLTAADRGRVHFLDESGQILGGLNWLRWIYLDRRDMGPLPPILKRLDAILARLLA
jgi:Ser/Thr protein kinase RdoA (MazF antagonist)